MSILEHKETKNSQLSMLCERLRACFGPRGLRKKRDKIDTIVQSRTSYICRLVPPSLKNGAPFLIRRVRRGPRRPYFTDVRSGAVAACDAEASTASTVKMAVWPLKKRHSAPIFHDVFDDYTRVFLQAFSSGRKRARIRRQNSDATFTSGHTLQKPKKGVTLSHFFRRGKTPLRAAIVLHISLLCLDIRC
jgi:hypothetical protein